MQTLRMSVKERGRLDVFCRVERKELNLTRAAGLLKLSLRQTKRAWPAVQSARGRGVDPGYSQSHLSLRKNNWWIASEPCIN